MFQTWYILKKKFQDLVKKSELEKVVMNFMNEF